MSSSPPDRRERLRTGVVWTLLALASGVAAVAGSYAAVGRTPAFIVTPLDDVVSFYTPGAVVSFAITALGDVGKHLAFLLAIGLTAGVVGVVALPAVYALRTDRRLLAVALGGALPAVVAAVLTGLTPGVAGAAVGGALVFAVAGLVPRMDATAVSGARRQLLGAVGAAAGATAVGALLRSRPGDATRLDGVPEDVDPSVEENLQTADEQSLDVAGLEPLVSTNFYKVDINNVDPDVATDEWSLSITGAVDEERTLTYDDLTAMPAEDRFSTLRCVGDTLNGKKLDNALWTGVPITDVLEAVTLSGEFVMLRAADDYYEEFPVAALREGLLAYEMNGRPLPRSHGAPVRALIPGHWGEINVKWVTEMEILDRPAKGYWEKRGWQGTGPVKTVAKHWVTNRLDDGRIELGGVAHAGTRGISAVEVSTDGGATWNEATLSEPLPGPDVWRQWVYRYEQSGPHTAIVRAIDGDGTVQTMEESGPRPSGPTGWVSTKIR
jgi:DMSO/TMAO reductase YedYZ molybdopterin-dependent catalytic subunit